MANRKIHTFLILLVILILAGCEGIQVRKKYQGGLVYVPATEFNESEVKARAEKECNSINMTLNRLEVTDAGHAIDNTILGYKYFNYFCDRIVEIQPQTDQAKPPQLDSKPTVQVEIRSEKITVEEAKTKCADLGFKPKTEKFGSCVLELMK